MIHKFPKSPTGVFQPPSLRKKANFSVGALSEELANVPISGQIKIQIGPTVPTFMTILGLFGRGVAARPTTSRGRRSSCARGGIKVL